MTVTFDRLPFDILFYISQHLQFDDIIHVAQTCRQLRLLLNESTLCRKAIEARAPHSKEVQLARDQRITYGEAMRSIYDRRDAFSKAFPFSARTLGQGTAFTYRQGVLCVLNNNVIRVSDVHAATDPFDIKLREVTKYLPTQSTAASKFFLLHYSDDIVTVCSEREEKPNNARILAIRTTLEMRDEERLIRDIPLESSSKLFARHDSNFLVYGTYTAMGDHGHHEWELRTVALKPHLEFSSCIRPLQLEEFFGTDIGSTITFEVHNGYFYAVSNQTSFDVEELDWTSFYHCIRFPLDDPVPAKLDVNQRVYRRQHAEGPIHDSWTDLTIQTDEYTNKPIIVESRREWQRGSSRQLRSFYISEMEFKPKPTTPSASASPTIGATNAEPLLPLDDPFSNLVDSTNNPHYAPWQPRFSWNVHPEFAPDCLSQRSFILARTKFRAYNYSCSSFIDLVEDERCCGDALNPCLRIRVGSRRAAPLDWAPIDKAEGSKGKDITPPEPDDDIKYRHSTIKMWPPPANTCLCSQKLHEILNPKVEGSGRSITGVVDERSFVYMVKPGRSYSAEDKALGTIVLVNFNREPTPKPTPSSKTDCPLFGSDTKTKAQLASEWHWQPGHFQRCQKGECG